MRAVTFLGVFFLSIGSVYAQNGKPEACALIPSDEVRLACYDKIFANESGEDEGAPDSSDVEKEEPTPKDIVSSWVTRSTKSEIDDSQTVILRTRNIETVYNEYGREEPITLIIRCMENTTSMYLSFDRFFVADHQGAGDVTFRVDDNKAFTRSLRESTDNHALGLWRGGNAIPFVKRIMGGDKLVVRARPYSGSYFTTSFDIAGLDQAIQPLREACHW
jgi:type VI secretion system protein VasI